MSDLFTIRASSLSRLLDCAHAWEGIHLLGMTSPRSAAAQLGTAIHAGTAVYDVSRMNHEGITPDEAAGAVVDALHRPTEPVDWGEESPKELEKIAIPLHTKYCTEVSPRYEFKAIEMTIPPVDIDVGGVTIRLTGTMDRTRVRAKQIGSPGAGISDIKTGKTAVGTDGRAKTTGHAAQLGIYELLYEQTTGDIIELPAEIIGLQTNSKMRVGTAEIKGARDLLIGHKGEAGLLEMAASMLKAGLFPPNPRSMLCSEKYCPRWNACRFRDRD